MERTLGSIFMHDDAAVIDTSLAAMRCGPAHRFAVRPFSHRAELGACLHGWRDGLASRVQS